MLDFLKNKNSSYYLIVITLIASIIVPFIRIYFEEFVYAPVDYGVYRDVGPVAFSGADLYTTLITGHWSHGLPFVYTPFAAVILSPLNTLSEPFGFWLWTAFTTTAMAYIVATSLQHTLLQHPAKRKTPPLILFSGALLILLPTNFTVHHLVFGQINYFIAVLCIYDALPHKRRFVPQGFLTGVAAGIKLTPLLFIAFMLYSKRWKETLNALSGLLATIIIGAIALPQASVEYFTKHIIGLSSVIELDGFFSTSGNSSLQGVSERWFGTHSLTVLAPAILLIVCAAFWSAKRATQHNDPLTATAIIGISMCILSPVSWLHHWVWIIPALCSLLLHGTTGKTVAALWLGTCLAQATDLGDILARADAPMLIVEILRSSMVLWGLIYITLMVFTHRKLAAT